VIVAFDSSVLVAAALDRHPRHAASRRWLQQVVSGRIRGTMVSHARAEVFATVTAIPHLRVAPAVALRVVGQLTGVFSSVACDDSVYTMALERCAGLGLASGAVYDALHMVAAECVAANAVLTWNPADFERLRAETSPRVLSPDAGEECVPAK
jgi:predicted nucleic acid-binding protein